MRALERNILHHLPTIVWGPPGVGKTAVINAIAKKHKRFIGTFILSHHEPPDIAGWPLMTDGKLRFVPPVLAEELVKSRNGILFIDEFSTANYALQAPTLRLIHERCWGDMQLPPTISIVLAGNPPDTSSGTYYLSAAAANRPMHLTFALNPLDWCQHFPTYWGEEPEKPDLSMAGWRLWRARIAGYIHSRPQALHVLPKSEAQRGGAWPSPRSWDLFSQACADIPDPQAEIELVAEFGAGCIGEGVSQEFIIYLRDLDLPDPALLLKNPDKFRMPKRGDQAYALLSAIVSHALHNLTPEIWMAAWQIMGAAYKEHAGDLVFSVASPLATIGQKKKDLPLPEKELKRFTPLLILISQQEQK